MFTFIQGKSLTSISGEMNVKLLPHLNGQYDPHLEILSIRKKIGGGSTARKDPTRSFLGALALGKVNQA